MMRLEGARGRVRSARASRRAVERGTGSGHARQEVAARLGRLLGPELDLPERCTRRSLVVSAPARRTGLGESGRRPHLNVAHGRVDDDLAVGRRLVDVLLGRPTTRSAEGNKSSRYGYARGWTCCRGPMRGSRLERRLGGRSWVGVGRQGRDDRELRAGSWPRRLPDVHRLPSRPPDRSLMQAYGALPPPPPPASASSSSATTQTPLIQAFPPAAALSSVAPLLRPSPPAHRPADQPSAPHPRTPTGQKGRPAGPAVGRAVPGRVRPHAAAGRGAPERARRHRARERGAGRSVPPRPSLVQHRARQADPSSSALTRMQPGAQARARAAPFRDDGGLHRGARPQGALARDRAPAGGGVPGAVAAVSSAPALSPPGRAGTPRQRRPSLTPHSSLPGRRLPAGPQRYSPGFLSLRLRHAMGQQDDESEALASAYIEGSRADTPSFLPSADGSSVLQDKSVRPSPNPFRSCLPRTRARATKS